jgi:hypothetical protein
MMLRSTRRRRWLFALRKYVAVLQVSSTNNLAYLLGRPCSYILYNFAQSLGERIVRLLINAIVGSALALLVVGLPHITWMGLLA